MAMNDFFRDLINHNKTVNIITINGFQIKCVITRVHKLGSNSDGISAITVRGDDGTTKHIMLHAISTIVEL